MRYAVHHKNNQESDEGEVLFFSIVFIQVIEGLLFWLYPYEKSVLRKLICYTDILLDCFSEQTHFVHQRSTMAPAENESSPSIFSTEKYLGHSGNLSISFGFSYVSCVKVLITFHLAVLRDYSTSTRPEDVSYFAFLNANRSTISMLPPFSKTWNAMQSSWS